MRAWARRCVLGPAVLALASLTALVAHAAPDAAALRQAVDRAVRPVIARYDVPGMAIAVTVDGHAFFFNYGVASRETRRPVSEATLFELGSVSKTFTATLASYAQVLGKLSLADHPGRYLPALKGAAVDDADLLELGTYTASGLPLQVPDAVNDDAAMVGYLRGWKPESEPGARRRYSNVSIGLLGRVTALALQREFADALEHELLPRLGLAHTYVHVPAGAMADYAWGYDGNRRGRVSPGVFDEETYGIKTSAADMIRFVQLNIDPGPLDAPVRRAIAGTHVGYFETDGGMVQGLGWEQVAYPVTLERLLQANSSSMIFDAHPVRRITAPATGARLYDKTGSTRCFGAYVAFVPDRRIGVVMLANRNFPIPERVRAVSAILDALAAGG